MAITSIKKRDGSIVDFDRSKIERAIEKAFRAHDPNVDTSLFSALADDVVSVLDGRFGDARPSVEDIQDIVEIKLIDSGHINVARSFIVYRAEHKKRREVEQEKLLKKIERSALKVKKRDGSVVDFNISEIEEAVKRYARGYEDFVNVQEIVDECKLNIFDGISTFEINQALVLVLRAKIEQEPAYSKIAARLLLNNLYKNILGVDEFDPQFLELYRAKFEEQMRRGVEGERLEERMLNFDFAKLTAAFEPANDHIFDYLGAQTLADRYFLKDAEQKTLELPQYFWMRVAMGVSLLEKPEVRDARTIEAYKSMSSLRYVPSTPTLFHAGTRHPQMSSCYLNTVEDDLHHIFKVIGDNAQLSKWSGGIGTDWTNIRSVGSRIGSINVESQGVVAFLKVVDATTAAINRSGKRRGATCVYLETWHYEIEDFLELKKNTGDERRRTHDINTSNWIPDLFMKRVLADQDWTLFSPHEVSDLHHLYGKAFENRYAEYERMAREGKIKLFRTVKASDLWKKMLSMLFSTGHPWITFKDPSNIRSPQDHVGVVHSSNLCTEITLNTSKDETAVCNLGSVNLYRHVTADARIDKDLLADTVRIAMRMLDNVIDLNFYPTVEAKTSNLRHRPVGLGIMGFQNLLYRLDMYFESEKAIELSDELMEFISFHAVLSSSKLAEERGAYETFKGSKWDRGIFPIDTIALLENERGVPTGTPMTSKLDWAPVRESVRKFGMRNSNTMAIAPTATISNISGCFPSIEPIYKNIYVKSNQAGEFTIVNSDLIRDLKQLSLWSKDMLELIKRHDGSIQEIPGIPDHIKMKYKEVFEIAPDALINHAVRRGKWIDQSQSLNMFSKSLSGRVLSDIYQLAWKKGLKTTYYLRTLAASQVDKATLDQAAAPQKDEGKEERREGVYAEMSPAFVASPIAASVMRETVAVGASSSSSSPAPSTIMVNKNENPQEALVCESCQ